MSTAQDETEISEIINEHRFEFIDLDNGITIIYFVDTQTWVCTTNELEDDNEDGIDYLVLDIEELREFGTIDLLRNSKLTINELNDMLEVVNDDLKRASSLSGDDGRL